MARHCTIRKATIMINNCLPTFCDYLQYIPRQSKYIMYFLVILSVFVGNSFCQQFLGQNSVEDVQKLLEEKCRKNEANEETVPMFIEEAVTFNTCLQSHLDFSQVQEELEESKRQGAIDEFVKKYCDEYPEMHECLRITIDKLRPCLNSSEKDLAESSLKFLKNIKEKLCCGDGIRISLFIGTGGIECMQEMQEQLQGCVNETLEEPPSTLSGLLLSTKEMFLEEACSHLMEVRACFRRELIKCESNIPANIIDAFFKFLKKDMSCKMEYSPLHEEHKDFQTKLIVGVVYLFVVVAICYVLAK